MPDLSPARLNEIEQRATAATDGPWYAAVLAWSSQTRIFREPYDPDQSVSLAQANVRADAEFIAHARSDVPALLDRVVELESAVAEYKALTYDETLAELQIELKASRAAYRLCHEQHEELQAQRQALLDLCENVEVLPLRYAQTMDLVREVRAALGEQQESSVPGPTVKP